MSQNLRGAKNSQAVEQAAKLSDFHFDLGDSTNGPIGFCASIKAASKAEAVEILQRALPESLKIEIPSDSPDAARIGYIEIYLNANPIQEGNIDAVDEESV